MATHAKAAARRASRSPLVLNISRLGRRPGSMMTVSETVPSPMRIGLDLIAIDEGAPLELDLRIESVSEGVLVSGTVSAPTAGECARCLSPITGHVEISTHRTVRLPRQRHRRDHRGRRGRPRRGRHRRPRAADHRCGRAGVAVRRRCADPTARACVLSAEYRWPRPNRDTSTTRSIRAGPSSPACSTRTSRD